MSRKDGALVAEEGALASKAWIQVTDEHVHEHGHTYLPVRGEPDTFVDEADVTLSTKHQGELPKGVSAGERWLEVKILPGTMTAYEGDKPVRASLFSPGKGGVPVPGLDHTVYATTAMGFFPIEWKDHVATMSNEKTEPKVLWFSDVPHIQYLRAPLAMHVAYWHEDFGNPKSAECVNVSPEDGAWLFDWTLPHLPEGLGRDPPGRDGSNANRRPSSCRRAAATPRDPAVHLGGGARRRVRAAARRHRGLRARAHRGRRDGHRARDRRDGRGEVDGGARMEKPARIVVSVVGDCTLGGPYDALDSPGSPAAELADHGGVWRAGLRRRAPRARGPTTVTIANLETTLPSPAASPIAGKPRFKGRPEFVEMLLDGSVELVNVANNHSHDFGERGYRDTVDAVRQASIGVAGNGIVDKRVVKGVTITNLGFTAGDAGSIESIVKAIRAERRAGELLFVSFHWGNEGFNAPNDVQMKLGPAAIDAGADLVIGTHPHVLQGIESYKGRHIIYSLGNFVFGGHSHPEDMDSMIVQEVFEARADRRGARRDARRARARVERRRSQRLPPDRARRRRRRPRPRARRRLLGRDREGARPLSAVGATTSAQRRRGWWRTSRPLSEQLAVRNAPERRCGRSGLAIRSSMEARARADLDRPRT